MKKLKFSDKQNRRQLIKCKILKPTLIKIQTDITCNQMKIKVFAFLPIPKPFIMNTKIIAARKEISSPRIVILNISDPYKVNIIVFL